MQKKNPQPHTEQRRRTYIGELADIRDRLDAVVEQVACDGEDVQHLVNARECVEREVFATITANYLFE